MSRWPSEKHFCAWLNVAPNNRISGGKILSSKPRKNANRAAAALRLAAQSAMQSKTAIGAFIRRIKTRLGAPTAINAGAHKLARLLYRMLKFGKAYVETGQQAYEKLFKERALSNLQRRAREPEPCVWLRRVSSKRSSRSCSGGLQHIEKIDRHALELC